MPNHTTYTDDLAEFVIDGLWQGKTMPQLEKENPTINRRTVTRWRKAHPEFDKEYQDAMTGGAWALVESTREIVDNLGEPADSRKLRAWQRFVEAKRKAPNELSEKVRNEITGPNGGPLQYQRVEIVAVEPE